jgi:glycosyltransferase involved in cell wall biosynthesis
MLSFFCVSCRIKCSSKTRSDNQPVVSVIITTYNRKAFLADAVKSVFNQDYEGKEIIVIDDGSTDGSQNVIEGLPLQYVWKENGGISSARNHGVAIARGDFISFLDVDDLWKQNKLSVQMSAMAKENAMISYTDEIWMRNGKWLNQGKRHRKFSGTIYEKCLPLCIISPSSVIIKRQIFDVVGLFDESLPVCEDYDMWLRICCQYPALFIAQPLIVKQGGHGDQLSKNYEVMDIYRIQALLKILASGVLEDSQRTATIKELKRKCLVVANGAEKRGRTEESKYYWRIVEHNWDTAPFLHD